MIAHVGALRAWDGRPPVGIKLVHRGPGGGRRRRADDLPARRIPDAFRGRRDGDRRHGQRPARRADADGRAARHGDGHGRGRARSAGAKHSGQFGGAAPDALIVAAAGARLAARRARRRRRRGPAARASGRARPTADDEFRELGRGAATACRCSAPAASARACGPGRRSRSPASTCRRSTDALNAVSPYARAKINLRVHPEQDAVEAQAALVRHLEAREAVRDRARRRRRARPATASRPRRRARPTRRRARRGGGLGQRRRERGRRRLDPARQRAPGRRAPDAEIAARRRHRRLREHPRARRARAARRVREGGRRRGRLLRRYAAR